jgi:ubiquinone/menaquinone biosynthesis C-methylase UbiE
LGAAARIAGADLQPAMVAMARTVAPDIEWHEADAMALPFEESAFDRVFCQQGLQFFPDRAAGVREMRRVLTAGGPVAISTWCALDEQPFLAAIHRAASRHIEVPPDRRLSLGDAGELVSLLEGAGFREVRVETAARTERYADAAQIVRLHTMAIVPGFSAMDPAERDRLAGAVLDEMKDTIERFADGNGVAYEMRANIATARA